MDSLRVSLIKLMVLVFKFTEIVKNTNSPQLHLSTFTKPPFSERVISNFSKKVKKDAFFREFFWISRI